MVGSTFNTNPIDLQRLLEDCHEGIIRLPDFQRSWVLDEDRIKSLIASASRDFPLRFQDYAIVHKLLHLRYSTHGKVLRALMSAHVPHWRQFDVASPNNTCGGLMRTENNFSSLQS